MDYRYLRLQCETGTLFPKRIHHKQTLVVGKDLYAVGGLYELFVNGKRIGDHGSINVHRFDRRNLYVTYDVTENLQQGKNTIGVLLGNGWYNHQSTAVWYFDKAPGVRT